MQKETPPASGEEQTKFASEHRIALSILDSLSTRHADGIRTPGDMPASRDRLRIVTLEGPRDNKMEVIREAVDLGLVEWSNLPTGETEEEYTRHIFLILTPEAARFLREHPALPEQTY